MPRWISRRFVPALVALATLALAACTSSSASTAASGASCTTPPTPSIIFAAYSTPREVYNAKIIPAFKALWKEQTGVEPQFFESYTGSTTQAQNVVNGSGADVVALSLAPDVDTIADAGLITDDWTAAPDGGMVSSSVVVFDVRPGNPRGIQDWNDVGAPGVGVLTPDPDQSGGARWNLISLWGSAIRGDVPGVAKDDEPAATTLMDSVAGNVLSWDSSARSSIQNFEEGNGDVAITYENEVKTAQAAGLEDEAVYPKGSIMIENPVAVVNQNAAMHCVTDVAEAFVEFLHTEEAKGYYTEYGYLRSTDPKEAAAGDPANGYPAIQDLFTIEDLGGWDAVNEKLFSENGVATQAKANAS